MAGSQGVSVPRSITISTVQGIGDIFWTYQKLAPHFDEINLKILVISDHEVQYRAQEFTSMLPKVVSCRFEHVDLNFYNSVAHGTFHLEDLNYQDDVPYCVNAPLERGIRLEAIDGPHFWVEVPVLLQYKKPAPWEFPPYLCMFVAPNPNDYVWTPSQWTEMAIGLLERMGISTVVLIGARWDRGMACEIESCLGDVKFGPLGARKRTRVINLAGRLSLSSTIQIIREAKFLLAYQSGLSVIADNYDVPQLMVYFPWLGKLMRSWPKQPNIADQTYQSVLFDWVNFRDLPLFLDRLKLP